MKVAISGASGFVGSSLVPFLQRGSHETTSLVRMKSARSRRLGTQGQAGRGEVRWDPESGSIDLAGLEGHDAVIHLAGENIAGGRWTKSRKERILKSRSQGTRLLAESLAKLAHPPRVLISVSGVNYYGDRGDTILTEDSPSGEGFLSEVCRQWEAATKPASERGIRVVILRNGVVLGKGGGILGKMLPPFRMGVGGKVGSGKQYYSWIAMEDLLGIMEYAMKNERLRGPANAVAPNPVTNQEFTRTLGKVLSRPTIFPLPTVAAKLAFGEMADEMLLASARVVPAKLQAAGYAFRFPDLEGALRHLLLK